MFTSMLNSDQLVNAARLVDRVVVAVILSVIILGVGQMYLGRLARGIVILVVGVALNLFLTIWLGWFGFVFGIGYWLWNIYDAYKIGKAQQNPSQPK
jgi:TM2 domain-containing membrane protein YozV